MLVSNLFERFFKRLDLRLYFLKHLGSQDLQELEKTDINFHILIVCLKIMSLCHESRCKRTA